ncbi:MAG: serine/threonine protein kinase [Bacteroidales bacterium]|nr:serine/threonine protein kinase [Bacteroidales bacterium]
MVDESGFFFVASAKETWGAVAPERIGGSVTGWSEVWLVESEGKFRVLKSLKKNYRGLPLYEGLLKKEYEIGFSLSHSNICQTYSFYCHPDLGNCIEMEWVDGRSLDAIKEECRKDPLLARKVILEICDALSCIHSHQIAHQDLKPSNILVTYNGNNVKIIDFGLSLEDCQSEFKIPGGTKSYAAPELLEGKKADVLSDIYSLGKVIEQISTRYGKIVRRCCKQDPAERFMCVADVKDAILKKDTGKAWILPASVAVAAVVVAVLFLIIGNRSGDKPSSQTAPSVNLTTSASDANIQDRGEENGSPLGNFSEKESGKISGKELEKNSEKSSGKDKNKPESGGKESGKQLADEKTSKMEVIEDEADIDKLFESVTDLFEEKEDGR